MATYHRISESKILQLQDFFKTAKIHAELDWELTCANNGTNAGEACNVLEEIFSILELTPPDEPTHEEIAEAEEEGE